MKRRLFFILAIFGAVTLAGTGNGTGTGADALAADKTTTVSNGWYNSSFPVPVMHLEGTAVEAARAHGALAAMQPQAGATLHRFGHLAEDHIRANPFLRRIPFATTIANAFFQWLITENLYDHVPDEYREIYSAFAQAGNFSTDDLWNALTLPDGALKVLSLTAPNEPLLDLNPSFGCTSIIWDLDQVSVLHARNLDYEGVGFWDRSQVILHVVTKKKLAFVAMTALGMHAPGLTAFNEAGLTIGVHQLYNSDISVEGTPMPIIAFEVIRTARDINDAINIIRGFPHAGAWAYVLTDGRDRAVVETSASKVSVRRSSEPFFFQTNHVSHLSTLRGSRIAFTPGSELDSHERAETLASLAKTAPPRASVQKTREWLAAYGPDGDNRIAGGITAKLENIQSVIMDAAHRRLWIGTGGLGVSPAEGNFHMYQWGDLRSARPPRVVANAIAPVQTARLGTHRAALRQILRRAARSDASAYERHALLRQYYLKARALEPADARGYWPGLFLFVFNGLGVIPADRGMLLTLSDALDLALKDPDLHPDPQTAPPIRLMASKHRLSLAHLIRGRLYDLSSKRDEALAEYRLAVELAPYARVRDAAESGLKNRYTWSKARLLTIDWSGIDLIRY